MDDMLWSLDPDNDYMEKTILRMRESAEGLQHTYGTEIQIEIDEKVKSIKMDMRTRHELFLIFKEALRTVASNSGSGSLVNADLSGGKLLVKIHNGGMNANGDLEVERVLRSCGKGRRLSVRSWIYKPIRTVFLLFCLFR